MSNLNETNYIRTVYGAALNSATVTNKPIQVLPFSTLNEALGIHADKKYGDNDFPFMNLLVIGIDGHRTVRVSGIDTLQTLPHLPTHAGLYHQIPMVLRTVNNDLSAAERTKYRLRKVFQHTDNQTYVAYYGLVLDLTATDPKITIRARVNGKDEIRDFVPTVEDLRPTKPVLESNTELSTTGEYAFATGKVLVELTPTQVQEIVMACKILYGNESVARITEAALCHSVDHVVTGDFNGTSMSYTEAIGVQVNTFVSIDENLNTPNKTVKRLYEVGSVEPLMALKRV